MDKCLCDGAISLSQAKYAAVVHSAAAKKAAENRSSNGTSNGSALLNAASAGTDPAAVALFAAVSGLGAALDLKA